MSREATKPRANKIYTILYARGVFIKNKRAIEYFQTHYAICAEASAYLNGLSDGQIIWGDLIDNIFYPHDLNP